MTVAPTGAPPIGIDPPPWSGELHPRHRGNDLHRGVLSHLEVFGQSLAATGPSIAIAGTVPIAYGIAGTGTIYSFVFGTIIVLLVGYAVAQFARRAASTGSLYSFVTAGVGRTAGFATGWGLVIGYTGIASACLCGSALYAGALLDEVGLTGSTPSVLAGLLVAATVTAALIPLRGVRVSVRVGIVLEVISLIAIFAVLVATVVHFGAHLDTTQFTAKGSSANAIALGAVVAVTCFVGFESAGSLGVEARNPFVAIPRAVLFTVAGAGVLYIVSTYIQVIGYQRVATPLASTSAPLNAIADAAGASWLSGVIDVGITVSALACASASLTGAARTLFNLSRERALPPLFGQAHARFRTPHLAIGVLAPIGAAVPLAFLLFGSDLLTAYGDTAIVGTFGYLLAYLLVAIAAPLYRRRLGEPLGVLLPVISTLAFAAILYVLYRNLVPVPAWPLLLLPYVFAGLLVAGLGWYALLRARDPGRTSRLGGFVLHATGVPAAHQAPVSDEAVETSTPTSTSTSTVTDTGPDPDPGRPPATVQAVETPVAAAEGTL